jgi:hypothetical protein
MCTVIAPKVVPVDVRQSWRSAFVEWGSEIVSESTSRRLWTMSALRGRLALATFDCYVERGSPTIVSAEEDLLAVRGLDKRAFMFLVARLNIISTAADPIQEAVSDCIDPAIGLYRYIWYYYCVYFLIEAVPTSGVRICALSAASVQSRSLAQLDAEAKRRLNNL